MKLATVFYNHKECVGIVKGEEIFLMPREISMEELIRKGTIEDAIRTGAACGCREDAVPLKEVSVLAPIPRPSQDVICLGMNFADHTDEAAKFHPTMVRENYAVYFSKRVNLAVPDGGMVDSHPDVTSQVDYEAEIAVIIGKDAYQVKKENARDYIFGYTILNDISAREVQTRHKQFYLGKSLDNFTPIGPWIVTAEEFSYPPKIDIRSYVNGELRQDGSTAEKDTAGARRNKVPLSAGTQKGAPLPELLFYMPSVTQFCLPDYFSGIANCSGVAPVIASSASRLIGTVSK